MSQRLSFLALVQMMLGNGPLASPRSVLHFRACLKRTLRMPTVTVSRSWPLLHDLNGPWVPIWSTQCSFVGGDSGDRPHVFNGGDEKGKQPKGALEIFATMQQQGIVPNVITNNALISACEKGKQPERALEIFATMQQQGIVPDVITYSA